MWQSGTTRREEILLDGGSRCMCAIPSGVYSSPLMQQRSFAESATMETNPLLQKLDVVSSFEKAIDLIDVRSVFISVKDRDTKRDLLKTTSGY